MSTEPKHTKPAWAPECPYLEGMTRQGWMAAEAAIYAAMERALRDCARVVPCCQREGCGKPLLRHADRHYLLISQGPSSRDAEQAIFCEECASDITGAHQNP